MLVVVVGHGTSVVVVVVVVVPGPVVVVVELVVVAPTGSVVVVVVVVGGAHGAVVDGAAVVDVVVDVVVGRVVVVVEAVVVVVVVVVVVELVLVVDDVVVVVAGDDVVVLDGAAAVPGADDHDHTGALRATIEKTVAVLRRRRVVFGVDALMGRVASHRDDGRPVLEVVLSRSGSRSVRSVRPTTWTSPASMSVERDATASRTRVQWRSAPDRCPDRSDGHRRVEWSSSRVGRGVDRAQTRADR